MRLLLVPFGIKWRKISGRWTSWSSPLDSWRRRFYGLKISWIRGNWPIRSWRDYYWWLLPRKILLRLWSWG